MPEGGDHEGAEHGEGLVLGKGCDVVIDDCFKPILNARIPILCLVFWVRLEFKHDRPADY